MDLLYFVRYLAVVVTDGDYLNDWLAWLPAELTEPLAAVGQWIASLLP